MSKVQIKLKTKDELKLAISQIIEVDLDEPEDNCPFLWDDCMCNHPSAKEDSFWAGCQEDGPESCPLRKGAVLVRMKGRE